MLSVSISLENLLVFNKTHFFKTKNSKSNSLTWLNAPVIDSFNTINYKPEMTDFNKIYSESLSWNNQKVNSLSNISSRSNRSPPKVMKTLGNKN